MPLFCKFVKKVKLGSENRFVLVTGFLISKNLDY